MKYSYRAGFAALLASCVLSAANPGITLIGMGAVPGDSLDLSGFDGQICSLADPTNCIPRATLGGFGSGITYTGHDNVFVAVPDRGPFDGRTDVDYVNRFHFMSLITDVNAPFPNIRFTLLDTRVMKMNGKRLVGSSAAFNADEAWKSLRFDPEAIRVAKDKTFFVSDEYGPYIYQFDAQGNVIQRVDVPDKFKISTPSADVDDAGNSLEIYANLNTSGRQANRGMEGLAITPDGRYLVGIMQNALIQDNGLDSSTPPARVGLNNRILRIDLQTGNTQEFVYTMDAINQGRGVNDLLAINDHEFLVLERDNRTYFPTPPAVAAEPLLKRLYKIDLAKTGLTDVSAIGALPLNAAGLTSAGITAVDKVLFLDLLDAQYKINATQTIKDVVAEKIEGIAWGPDLEDGRHTLYVTSDNDLYPGLPTKIYSFAVDAAAAKISYQPQELPKRIFPKAKAQ